ncbi:hypothetical protein BDV28DRAFT_157257 [Aspergillus coremiiformis]|uniref:Zn(2)-C6 fungal-type domain-containing protein n=1 Tax=Aspergillus coremiiformis TaxID=138285 RepID=A0A5N6ZAR0_9EURO|nr:hypothetical protein BDV28DRAFT_157257 [Aspergillus coremiiformis]
MASTKAAKASRITTACNACRFRKQKVQPVCTQCLQHNRRCDWPEQLKRGPAKGYIESLEHRLHETENVLLQVLSRISDAQLSASIAQNKQQHRSRHSNGDSLYCPFPRLGKRGAEYWKEFPLDTAHRIREWQYDCLSHVNQSLGPSTPSIPDMDTPEFTEGMILESNDQRELSECSPSNISRPDMYANRQDETGISLSPQSTSPLARHVAIGPGETQLTKTVRTVQTDTELDLAEGLSSIPQEPNFWSGAPSIDFQQQFLW